MRTVGGTGLWGDPARWWRVPVALTVRLKGVVVLLGLLRSPYPLLALILLVPLAVAGCADEPAADVRLEVNNARIEEGDCTFGERGEASDPEWCHVLIVRVHNEHHLNEADLSATSWRAEDDRFGSYSMPVVQGETELGPGDQTTVGLGFSAPPETRLTRLHYEGPFGGTATASVPGYSGS